MNLKWYQYPAYWIGKRSKHFRMWYEKKTGGKYLWGIIQAIRDTDLIKDGLRKDYYITEEQKKDYDLFISRWKEANK